jgi:two-component sensor histidine kinase
MLKSTYLFDSAQIRFVEQLDAVSTTLKKAVPIGLILNELITNSIKYAYPNGSAGEVRIRLASGGGTAVLSVSDDGPGLPSGLNPETTESLGLQIVGMLAKQIGGKIRFESVKGTSAELAFKL